jgi:hypothetical protein
VGRPHLPTVIPTKTDTRNRPSTASGARIRGVQVKRRWIIGTAAPLDPAAPMKMGPHTQPTSLTYKRILTPTGSNTPRKSISFLLFSSLRVGRISVAWELESSRASLGVPEESSSEFRYCSYILSLFRIKYNLSYPSILLFESITFSFYFGLEALFFV